MKPTVFIQTNPKQIVGAKVAEYALRRNSQHNDEFDIVIMNTEDHPYLKEMVGKEYLRDGVKRVWIYDDLQSFTPLRFRPPELMGYEGKAVVIDPDVFAVGDVWDLLSRDMQGKAILCRPRRGAKGRKDDRVMATSVMLLDCAKLRHWKVEDNFLEMFRFEREYQDWLGLKLEPLETIGLFEDDWNDLDKLTPKTKMLHTTRRKTQPWKTGLPIDWRPAEGSRGTALKLLMRARRQIFGEYAFLGRYRQNPDPNQERFFFGLLKECLDKGIVTEPDLRAEMARNHVRHDAFEVLARTEPLAPPGQPPLELAAQA